MKTTSILSLVLCCFFLHTHAQYKQNKLNFNYKEYHFQKGDQHNPTLAGVASFLIPGFGQVIAGETGRGVAFFIGNIASYGILLDGTYKIIEFVERNPNYEQGKIEGSGEFLFGLASLVAITIWSSFDAVRVAKVNNLAFRARTQKNSVSLSPTLMNLGNSNKFGGGISMKITLN